MSLVHTDALLIRKADFSESSRVVTFFTRDAGKISAVAKGAKRLKGPFEAALDLLATCRIVFIRKSTNSLDILTEAKLLSRFVPHARDINSLYGGYYVAELLSSLTEEYDPHPDLYDLAIETLDRLAHSDNSALSILLFELHFLHQIGHLPALDVCMACGTELGQNGPFGVWTSQGGLICNPCRNQNFTHLLIQPGTLAVLRRLAGSNDRLPRNVVVSDQQRRESHQLLMSTISALMGRRPKMYRYLNL